MPGVSQAWADAGMYADGTLHTPRRWGRGATPVENGGCSSGLRVYGASKTGAGVQAAAGQQGHRQPTYRISDLEIKEIFEPTKGIDILAGWVG